MILDNNGTKVYTDKVYTKQELEELRTASMRARENARNEVDSATSVFAAAQERLTTAQDALIRAEDNGIWVDKALAEFPPEGTSADGVPPVGGG